MMKMRPMLTVLTFCILSTGCTSAANRIADEGLTRGLNKSDEIIADLSRQARYYASEYYSMKVNSLIAEDADEITINETLSEMINAISGIDWLAMQTYSRAREYTRFGQRYIWEHRGILELLLEDTKKARRRTLADLPAKETEADVGTGESE